MNEGIDLANKGDRVLVGTRNDGAIAAYLGKDKRTKAAMYAILSDRENKELIGAGTLAQIEKFSQPGSWTWDEDAISKVDPQALE